MDASTKTLLHQFTYIYKPKNETKCARLSQTAFAKNLNPVQHFRRNWTAQPYHRENNLLVLQLLLQAHDG